MPHYHFDLQNSDERIDALGGVTLDDDSEALAFGKRVIRECWTKAEQHARWTMEINEGDRTVQLHPARISS